jgi:SnoaL-like domain
LQASSVAPVKIKNRNAVFKTLVTHQMKAKNHLFFLAVISQLHWGCNQNSSETKNPFAQNSPMIIANSKKEISLMLNSFNAAAAKADFHSYFNFFAEGAVFCGTDAKEHWDKNNFMTWTKPYFDKKTTWDFKSMERHIYLGKDLDIAWFDELLNTQMKICRGSGVIVKQNNEWKIAQYVLSMTMPNSETQKAVKIKATAEDSIINKLSGINTQ